MRFFTAALRSMDAMVMPVSSMAMGDMQFPNVVKAELKKEGIGSPVRPSTAPRIIPINIGFSRLESPLRKLDRPPLGGISR